jgi:predicted GIY-YIG superfamily endonuclease/ribosomal protein S18 acetylase RimI-like enzyme
MAFIYVIHFDTKLAHAAHYIGCTESLRQRLEAHASGTGARLMEVLLENKISWQLGGLYQTTHTNMRRLERQLKNQHNSARFCEICTKQQSTFPGCKQYSVGLVTFGRTSKELSRTAGKITQPTLRFSTETETKETMQQIQNLMTADKDALGFIPCGGKEGLAALAKKGRILLAERGAKLVGYAAHTVNVENQTVKIQQACVADEDRFLGTGRRMITQIIEKHNGLTVEAKVRIDLAANHFWQAIGFKEISTAPHPTSGNILTLYRK